MAVSISEPPSFERKREKLRTGGASKLAVVLDFDRTVTRAFVGKTRAHTGIDLIRAGGYLTGDYPEKAFALYDKYRPIELDPRIPLPEKRAKMDEWWNNHLRLLIDSGMDRATVKDILEHKRPNFRAGFLTFLAELSRQNVPVYILSAGVGDLIEGFLRKEGALTENVKVISNFFRYGANGKVISYKGPIIHSFSKDERSLGKLARKNILLVGDSLPDSGMVSERKGQTVLRIGYLNENPKEQKKEFLKKYDAVIEGDGNFAFPLRLVRAFLK
jgi:HAD superfamily hydrolase (TIGR01544 family)